MFLYHETTSYVSWMINPLYALKFGIISKSRNPSEKNVFFIVLGLQNYTVRRTGILSQNYSERHFNDDLTQATRTTKMSFFSEFGTSDNRVFI